MARRGKRSHSCDRISPSKRPNAAYPDRFGWDENNGAVQWREEGRDRIPAIGYRRRSGPMPHTPTGLGGMRIMGRSNGAKREEIAFLRSDIAVEAAQCRIPRQVWVG